MAYVVGSVSVEVVPDFRNAQNAITAWFKAQPNSLKVPVRPDLDDQSVAQVEREAKVVGDKVGKAMSEGAARHLSTGTTSLARQVAKLEKDIEKARETERDATDKLKIAEIRLDEARKAGNRSKSTLLTLEAAVERQNRRIAEAQSTAARSADELTVARQHLYAETKRLADEAAAKVIANEKKIAAAQAAAAQKQADREAAEAARREAASDREAARAKSAMEKEVREEIRAAERLAREREKIERDSEVIRAREAERFAREEVRRTEHMGRTLRRAAEKGLKEAEKIRIQVEIDQQKALRDGRTTGGLVVRAMEQEIHQNAGIIAAAIAGILAAGAPVLHGAAVGLFGAIGAVAAAQSQEVRTAWLGTWQEIRTGATEDARIIAPAYERMAASIAQSFQRLRPEIRDTFVESEAQIDAFSESLSRTTDNVIPSLLRAVQNGMPVVVGFGSLLEQTGTGLGEAFDIISDEAATSGRVLNLLGGTMGELLPLVGKLTVQGAELATDVLPLVNSGFHFLNAAADVLGGSLASVGAGFFAFRAAEGTGRLAQKLSTRLGLASLEGGRFSGALGKAAGAAHSLSTAMPAVGIAAAVVAFGLEESNQKLNSWTDAILAGGEAAKQAAVEANSVDDFVVIGQWLGLVGTIEDAEQAAEDYLNSLNPLARAQAELERATNNLSFALEDEEAAGMTVAEAQAEVARFSREAAEAQAELEVATRGVTEAMGEQVDAAFAAVDASFAYQKSVDAVTDAQKDYRDAVKESGKGSEEASDALLKLNESMAKSVEAAYKLSFSELPATMDESQKKIIAAQAALDEMNRLVEAGFKLPPDLQELKLQLEGIVGGADAAMLSQAQLAGAFEQLGIAVESVPGEKYITVSDNDATPALIEKLEALDLTVTTLPDGSIQVSADTKEANDNLANMSALLAGLDEDVANPKVALDTEEFNSTARGVYGDMGTLGSTVAWPKVGMDDEEFKSGSREVYGDMGALDAQVAHPEADLYYDGFLNKWVDSMGKVADLDSQKPTPVGNLAYDKFLGGYRDMDNKIFQLDAKTPTPTGDLYYNPFLGAWTDATGKVYQLDSMHAAPTVSINDQASGTIQSIASQMANLQSRTITITTVNQVLTRAGVVAPQRADGGEIPLQRFDIGGAPVRFTGAIFGRGGPRDDLQPALVSPGEHVFDAHDVALMGGQQAVYAFREALNRGIIGARARDTGIRNVVAAGTGGNRESSRSIAGFVNNGVVNVTSEREMMRQAELRKREALASIGV